MIKESGGGHGPPYADGRNPVGRPMAAVSERNRRILLIDDNRAIHADFRKILTPDTAADAALAASEAALFSDAPVRAQSVAFETESAYQGLEGVALAQRALQAHRPFALAFVDVRMPPGIDGLETTRRLWAVDPGLQIVICTAYSDYTWGEIFDAIGRPDQIVILKKPFDAIEALQLAWALTEKWNLGQAASADRATLEAHLAQRTAELHETGDALRVARDALQAEVGKSQGLVRAAQNMMEGAVAAAARAELSNRELRAEIAELRDALSIGAGDEAPRATDLDRVLDEVLVRLADRIQRADAAVTHGPLPALAARAGQMARLLEALVGHAIEHGGQPPRVHVNAEQVAGAWTFSVSSNGPAPDSPAAEAARLPICRRIVELHGGRLWVEPGAPGAVFRFTLPEGADRWTP